MKPASWAVLALTLAILLSPATFAQPPDPYSFDFEKAEIVFESEDALFYEISIVPEGFIFDQGKKYNGTFASIDGGYVDQGTTTGYDGYWGQDGGGGNIGVKNTLIGNGTYQVKIHPTTGNDLIFRLNLIDANWDEPAYPTLGQAYKLLFRVYTENGSVKAHVYCQAPGTGTQDSHLVTSGITNNNCTYWNCVHSLNSNYSRNRDGFIFDGATLPDFSFNQVQVASVWIDFNAIFRGENQTNGLGTALFVTADPYTANTWTTLYFDHDALLRLNGALYVNALGDGNTLMRGVDEYPGEWQGLDVAYAASTFVINNTYLKDAVTGLNVYGMSTAYLINSYIWNCLYEGVHLTDCQAVHIDNCHIVLNGGNGINFEGMAMNSSVTHSTIGNTRLTGDYGRGNGIVAQKNASPYIGSCTIVQNAEHGVFAFEMAEPYIDSCRIYQNSTRETSPRSHDGVHANNCGPLTSVRYSQIYENNCGIRGVEASKITGYRLPYGVTSITWDNADSLARNCVYDNRYNLYLDESQFELGLALSEPGSTPPIMHFQGGENCIYNPLISPGGNGSFHGASIANVVDNFWYDPNYPNNLYYDLSGGASMDNNPVSDFCRAGCIGESMGAGAAQYGPMQSSRSVSIEAILASVASKAALQSVVSSYAPSLTQAELSYAYNLILQRLDSLESEKYFRNVLSGTSVGTIRLAAKSSLAKSLIKQKRYLDARTEYENLVQMYGLTNTAKALATRIHVAAMSYYASDKTRAEQELTQVLRSDPGNVEANTVWNLFFKRPFKKEATSRQAMEIPEDIRLSQVYPLPCTSESKIDVTLTEDQPIRLLVTDITGAQIAILHDGMETRGTHTYSFASIGLHSGTYLCVLSAGGSVRSSKLLIVK